jgi:hypothetical protein
MLNLKRKKTRNAFRDKKKPLVAAIATTGMRLERAADANET